MTTSTASRRTPLRRRLLRTLIGTGTVTAVGIALSACGSGPPAPDATPPTTASAAPSTKATPSSTPTTAPTTQRYAPADCSSQEILAALPRGAVMDHYACAPAGNEEWAATRVQPGPTVFFLRWAGGRWQAEDSSAVCGAASAGLPPALLDYCGPTASASTRPSPRPTPRPTAPRTPAQPSAAQCTSRAILAALPSGATMQRFSCARVGSTEWAAARVTPGDTVFFLQWKSGRWQAERASDVCGTASAGLPTSLERYCG